MALGAEFLDCFAAVNAVNESLRHVGALPMSVSTITLTGRLDVASLPVEDMRLAAELAAELGDEDMEFRVDCDLLKKRKRRGHQPSKRFRYQLPLKRGGKSLKVFHNGSIHATGCGSPAEFLDMVEALRGFVRDTCGREVRLVSFDIQLINTLFVLTCRASGKPMTVPPGSLLRKLTATFRPDFDTERHPSIKIPVADDAGAKVATVCVFQTGSVSIMGAKRPAHVARAYATVMAALDACVSDIGAPDQRHAMRTTTAKHALYLQDGYPFNAACCCAT